MGEAIERVGSVNEIDRALVEEPVRVLRLASAAVFREEESGDFRRSASAGWDARDLSALPQGHPLLGDLGCQLCELASGPGRRCHAEDDCQQCRGAEGHQDQESNGGGAQGLRPDVGVQRGDAEVGRQRCRECGP